jgi:hypothetical protein
MSKIARPSGTIEAIHRSGLTRFFDNCITLANRGYGAFSVSVSQLAKTVYYIQNQVEFSELEITSRVRMFPTEDCFL